MLSTSGTISCVPCPNNQYSLEGAMMRGSKVYLLQCKLCPYGGNCELGGASIRAKAGFWAEVTATATAPDSNSTSSTVLKMLPCPQGYCCENRSSGCVWNSNDACQGNRRQQYPLCGGCQQGFSQAINGVGCVADSECGGKAFLFFLALQLFVVWGFSALYALYASRYPPLISCLHSRLRPAACNSGAVAVVIYFGQMVMVVAPRGYDSLVGKAAEVAGELSMLRQLKLSRQGDACAWQGFLTVDRLIWQLCLPFVLLLLLPIASWVAPRLISCIAACGRLLGCSKNGNRGAEGIALGIFAAGGIALGSLPDAYAEPLIDPAAEADENGGEHEEVEPQEPPSMWGAVACLALFSFTGFAEGTLQLLNCVEVNHVRVLYYAGATACTAEWQWMPSLLLAMLLLGPLYTLLLQASERYPSLSCFRPPARLLESKLVRAFQQHATEPFNEEYWNGTAMLMLQRLFTVMCQSLSTEEVVSSLAATSVSFFFTLLQLQTRPYRVSRVNTLQLLALVCLTMISVLNSAQSAFESAGVDAEQYPALAGLLRDADLLMFLLLLPPPLLLLYHTVSAVSRGDDGTELVVVEDGKLNERRRHEEERVQLLAEKDRALAEKDAEKEQQLAEKDAEKEQQLAAKDAEKEQHLAEKDAEKEQQLATKEQQLEEMKQQLAENEAKIEQLLAEMASSGSKQSSGGAGAAGAGATKKGRQASVQHCRTANPAVRTEGRRGSRAKPRPNGLDWPAAPQMCGSAQCTVLVAAPTV
jgi:hypothetical protein